MYRESAFGLEPFEAYDHQGDAEELAQDRASRHDGRGSAHTPDSHPDEFPAYIARGAADVAYEEGWGDSAAAIRTCAEAYEELQERKRQDAQFKISAKILARVAAGQTVQAALDAVCGAGTYTQLAGEVYDELRARAVRS